MTIAIVCVTGPPSRPPSTYKPDTSPTTETVPNKAVDSGQTTKQESVPNRTRDSIKTNQDTKVVKR